MSTQNWIRKFTARVERGELPLPAAWMAGNLLAKDDPRALLEVARITGRLRAELLTSSASVREQIAK